MLLLAYDGSDDAKAAIDRSAVLMPEARATVLSVWEPVADALARGGSVGYGGSALFGPFPDAPEIDEDAAKAALACASEGADRARAAALIAEPLAAPRRGGVAQVILDTAEDLDADLIVLGTRGRSGLKSFLLGSVSHAVAQQADRPVLVVPSATVSRRRRQLQQDAATV